jgi:hypothetical protein
MKTFAKCVALCVLLSSLVVGCSKGPSGVYEAKQAGETLSIEFKSDNKVTMSHTGLDGKPETEDGTYTIEGDKVTVKIPSAPVALDFTYKGSTVEGSFLGATITFTKK